MKKREERHRKTLKKILDKGRKRGRPKGSKNKKKAVKMEEVPAKRGRGRPKGSKNRRETFKSIMKKKEKRDDQEYDYIGVVDYNRKGYTNEQLKELVK